MGLGESLRRVYAAVGIQSFSFFIYSSYHQQQKVSGFTKSVLLVCTCNLIFFLNSKTNNGVNEIRN